MVVADDGEMGMCGRVAGGESGLDRGAACAGRWNRYVGCRHALSGTLEAWGSGEASVPSGVVAEKVEAGRKFRVEWLAICCGGVVMGIPSDGVGF